MFSNRFINSIDLYPSTITNFSLPSSNRNKNQKRKSSFFQNQNDNTFFYRINTATSTSLRFPKKSIESRPRPVKSTSSYFPSHKLMTILFSHCEGILLSKGDLSQAFLLSVTSLLPVTFSPRRHPIDHPNQTLDPNSVFLSTALRCGTKDFEH